MTRSSSGDACPYCTAAKRLLDRRGVAYDEVTPPLDGEGRRELVERTGRSTFPRVFLDGAVLGGYQELLAHVARGGLRPAA